MLFGCLGQLGGGVRDLVRGRSDLVVGQEEEEGRCAQGLALLDEAGMWEACACADPFELLLVDLFF